MFDNSTSDFGNEQFCADHDYRYLTYHENKGLSFAYNRIIERLDADPDDYLIILDDDTELTEAYLKEIVECEKSEINLPVVRSTADGHIFSPSVIKNQVRSVTVESIEEIEGKHITAINSGMVIKLSVFEKVRYNESLFLDYVDHDFMEQVNDCKYDIKLLQSPILQNVARQNIKNSESSKVRLEIYGKDYKIFCCTRGHCIYYLFSFLKTTISYCINARSLGFFKIYLRCVVGRNGSCIKGRSQLK